MRKARPWYRVERDSWCVYLGGRPVVLAKGKGSRKEAVREWHRRMAAGADQVVEPVRVEKPSEVTVGDLLGQYREAHRLRHRPHTVAGCRSALGAFAERYGPMKAADLRPHHTEAWVADHPRWSRTTAWTYLGYLRTAFRWAERVGLLGENPLRHMTRPTPKARGAECVVTEDQHRALLAAAWPALREFLTALRETGARPGEVAGVTAADFDPEAGVWVLRDHKTAHLGKSRVVFLSPVVVELC